MTTTTRRARRSFGEVAKLPSGNYRARYVGPDGARHAAPHTFPTKKAAAEWLAAQQVAVAGGAWQHPDEIAAEQAQQAAVDARRMMPTGEYAAAWIAKRTVKGRVLAARTREEYERLWATGPLSRFAATPLAEITPDLVESWYHEQLERGTATQTGRAYDHLKSVLATAVADDRIDRNPCRIRGGSAASTGIAVAAPTTAELRKVIAALAAHQPRYVPLVILGANGLRFGEAIAIRKRHIVIERDKRTGAVDHVTVSIVQGVTRTKAEGLTAGRTKTDGSVREVAIFGDDAVTLAAAAEALNSNDALLTPSVTDPSVPLATATFNRHWDRARRAAGRPDLRFHALRHYSGTILAVSGATLRDVMEHLGHTTVGAAMRYQESASDRRRDLARRAADTTL